MVKIRPARMDDLEGIIRVEEETFGSIGENATASSAIMASRIARCNSGVNKWFWVAEKEKGHVVGYIVLQPTRLTPKECTSWETATDHGTLNGTFDEKGDNVYVVSLAVRREAAAGTSELLVHAAFTEWAASGKRFFMFCSRVPGFAAMHRKTGISIEDYWFRRRKDGSPSDPMLRMYWRLTGGAEPYILLKNGFPPDKESGGHGVLFAADDPAKALRAVAFLAYAAAIADKTK